jgi:D-amino-acid oxidase
MTLQGDKPDPAVLVIGAGVSGLTCALCLRRRGYRVTVVAEHFAPRVTSVVAGALWEWPPAVCGHHLDQGSLARSKPWCDVSYQVFCELAQDPATGVFVRPVTFYFQRAVADDAAQREKMAELRTRVRQFRHDAGLIAENGVNPALGLADAYRYLAPMIDTDVYLGWLLEEVRRDGCAIRERTIGPGLREQEAALLREYGSDVLVNCTGLGARDLTGDAVYPLRGALVRVRNDGGAGPHITEAHCVSRDGAESGPGFVFIVPRGETMLVLGGLAEPDEWDTAIGLENHEPMRDMYQRCLEFLPALRGATIDAAEPVRVGLRPFRQSVRLEREPGTRIIHNYGHGGSGVTLSWGCAREVVQQVEALAGKP